MELIIYIKNYNGRKIGRMEYVSRNVAHGLVEKGVAETYTLEKGKMFKSPRDKMMRPETTAERRARQRKNKYKTK